MEQSDVIRNIIAGWFDAVAKGDPSWVDRHLSRAALVIGTDPKEWWDFEQASKMLKGEALEMGGQAKITMGRLEGFQEGGIGWGIAHPTIMLPDGRSFSPRWGAVFRLEGGEWQAVQIHASVGVSNERLLG